jgi:predicted ATPase
MARKVPFYDDERFIRRAEVLRDKVESFDRYPYNIPAIGKLRNLEFDPNVTFLVGENGSGKSTLVEAIARAVGFNGEGGSKNFQFSTYAEEPSALESTLRVSRGIKREQDGFFLRAESFYNVASQIDDLDVVSSYGGRSLHRQSHGESFIALVTYRFGGNGLYILDEPEAALSPSRQLSLIAIIDKLARHKRSQFVIATHSPILLGYPHSTIYELSGRGIARIDYRDTEHYKVTLDFLSNRAAYFRHLCPEVTSHSSSRGELEV